MRQHRWVAYCPAAFRPGTGDRWFDQNSVREDLRVLSAVFDGLVLYGSSDGVERVPQVARDCGFRAVIAGVWNPKDPGEVARAVALGRAGLVHAVCVGNEGLEERYCWRELLAASRAVRAATLLPVCTTEVIGRYSDPRFWTEFDFLAVNVHPVWNGSIHPVEAVAWTAGRVRSLLQRRPSRPLLVKETGFPSAGAPWASEEVQKQFWELLSGGDVWRDAHLCAFEGVDAVWKHEKLGDADVGPHWGFWTATREPKLVARTFLSRPNLLPGPAAGH